MSVRSRDGTLHSAPHHPALASFHVTQIVGILCTATQSTNVHHLSTPHVTQQRSATHPPSNVVRARHRNARDIDLHGCLRPRHRCIGQQCAEGCSRRGGTHNPGTVRRLVVATTVGVSHAEVPARVERAEERVRVHCVARVSDVTRG